MRPARMVIKTAGTCGLRSTAKRARMNSVLASVGRMCPAILLVCRFVLCGSTVAADEGIILRVTAGKAAVTDWVAEATLDLSAARGLLGVQEKSGQVAVYELDASGSASKRVASQADSAGQAGRDRTTIAWQVPGDLAAGATRSFSLRFEAAAGPVGVKQAMTVTTTKDTATVNNGDIVLTHACDTGGMIQQVTVVGTKFPLTWDDKIRDGHALYYLANHRANRMEVKAAGPLRAVVETESDYPGAASKPRAVYRFTSYAGLPFVLVDADVTQESASQLELWIVQMLIGPAGFTHFAVDLNSVSGGMDGKFWDGMKWAAVYNEKTLLAVCASQSPAVYAVAGGGYLRCGDTGMAGLRYREKAALVIAPGQKAFEAGIVQQWSDILADPPRVRIAFEKLGLRVAQVDQEIRAREEALASLTGETWGRGHVAVALARQAAQSAREGFSSGAFGECLTALKTCAETLKAGTDQARIQTEGAIQTGIVMGHPFLANDRVAYLWSKPEDGAGLFSIFDRSQGRELLKANPSGASFWEITVKGAGGNKTYQSIGAPGKVTCRVQDGQGQISFRWSKENTGVSVEARLGAGDPFLRLGLAASSRTAETGFVNVAFPVITGIAPFSAGARQDTVLETLEMGRKKPSPLSTGIRSANTYPRDMQFTALIGEGNGLYFAREDREANRKTLTWMPDKQTETLSFSISEPVLNWGAQKPVREFTLSGDAVLGPFQGDWYDAARIYRKWALTAPWTAKGPIYERKDYPKWLLNAPYWYLNTPMQETYISQTFETQAFYEVPMVAHTYAYEFVGQDFRLPEHWPPRLGSEGLKQAVKQFQAKGIYIVPYINGFQWSPNTESYRTKDAENKAALWGPNRELDTPYGNVCMCPASRLWRDEMLDQIQELFGRYGVDGIYFDYLTNHTSDCYNTGHGHAIGGGNYWTKAVHGLYEECRALAKKLNPEAMLTGENTSEYCIDVMDTFLSIGQSGTTAPLFLAVYHGYANVYGSEIGNITELNLGRWWLMGGQNGWNDCEYAMLGKPPYQKYAALGLYYKRLLKFRWEFGAPYLGYGEMLRPPKMVGELPTITGKTGSGLLTVPVIESSAWKSPDGSVGIFFLNHDKDSAHTFAWTTDLAEVAGIDASKKVRISRWTPEAGLVTLKETTGGLLTETMEAKPLDIIALKLENIQNG